MKRNTIAFISAAMAAVMALSTGGVYMNAYAEKNAVAEKSSSAETSASAESSNAEKEEKEKTAALEKALTLVKTRITIPDKYQKFSYTENAIQGISSYNFKWEYDSGAGSSYNLPSVSVTVTGDIITGYERYDPDFDYFTNDPSLSSLTDKALISAAENTVKILDPDLKDHIRVKSDLRTDLRSSTVRITLVRVENGIDVPDNSGYVNIDKKTGELRGFSLTWWEDAKFDDPSGIISEAQMQKGFKENVPLIPYYVIETVEEDGSSKASIRYRPDKNKPLDALTGKPSSMEEDYKKAMDTDNYSLSDTYETSAAYGAYYDEDVELEEECADEGAVPAGSGSTKRVSFTEEEKLALLKSGDYLSKAGLVEKLLKDKYLGLNDKYVLSSAEFRINDSAPSGYSWDMNFTINSNSIYKQMSVSADASSGSIISFYKYSSDQPQKAVDIKSVNKTADEALKYYLPDIADEFKPDENNTKKNENTAYKETERYLTYDRYHEGITVTNNNVYISVNSDNEVMSFSYSYDRNVEFASPDIISTDAAYASLFGQRKFDLAYNGFTGLDGTPYTYLLYSMDDFTLDAKTGKLIESTKTDSSDICPYTDISGNWAEKYIRELYRYNIRLSEDGTEFKPDEIITEGEFSALLDKIYYSDTYYRMYGSYYYDDNSENTASSRLLTKAASAKLFVMARGADDYASLKGIYKTPFKDIKSSRDDIGYIALAYALGGAKADKNGNFNPESKVTRGYAMYLIYSIISNSTKK